MQVDRRVFNSFDWWLLAVTLAIVAAGLPVMYSASVGREGSGEIFADHLLRLALGLGIMLASLLVDYRLLTRYAFVLYGLNVAALLFVAVSGVMGLGARRWLAIGPLTLQPSEMFKITLILTMAFYLSRVRPAGDLTAAELGITALLLAVPLLLILKQPDLGTAAIVGFIWVTMLVVHGFSPRTWRALLRWGGGLALAALLLWNTGMVEVSHFLRPYQVKRILVLFEPDVDPLGASYQFNQSKIAIGSGGILGKGFLNGSQNQLRFLPQQHTDFIFSVLAEEWGFAGVVTVIALYVLLLFRALRTALEAKDRLGSQVALGVAAMIFFHVIINLGMTIGYVPVVGLPLPLLSYGGSSFLVVMAGIGLLLNVRMRRFVI